ncbi:alpha/beta hydrolase [Stutzerimonas stutzeri]|uniref:Putative membrane protein n=1 Tax=Stutzerimonas stutzeri RCH2 TaxID=644801 RepID=L0GH52_STUST|nr:alpha/beta-hydrolase family protein [Stutzerimonas stutzeri]AGA84649.1 putative membrane protein [Stutzerimonas stutzeri RCH2]
MLRLPLLSAWRSLSGFGLLLGTLFFCAALKPSLVPRSTLSQGVLAGAALAVGYGIGVLWRWLWRYLGLPERPEHLRERVNLLIAAVCVPLAGFFLSQVAGWQNAVRALMGMEPVSSAHLIEVVLTALATFLILLTLARLYRLVSRFVSRHADRILPRRVANVIGVLVALALFWSLATDVLVAQALRALDASFAQYDALIEPETAPPASPLKSGSAASTLRWEELGRTGRGFIGSGPSAAEISAVSGEPALEPIRVYVGLRAAETPRQRARLALSELQRSGAFERSVLVVVAPTGTGWIDPAAMNTVEYLHHGDIASVALQYSYLNSPLALLVEADYGRDVARALFAEIYAYWTRLPPERRPRLYLHGLSLGALHSQRSWELHELLGDPIHGALWSGPPFRSDLWRSLTDSRNEGSPEWRPQFRDGRFVRFMNQQGTPEPADAPWGPMRLLYLQYASDPITFFDHRYAWRRPDWLAEPRGPDVSPSLRWFPLVTMLQLAVDMAVTTPTPPGYGHVYAPADYVDAWRIVSAPAGWSDAALQRLKQHLAHELARASEEDSEEAAYGNRGG